MSRPVTLKFYDYISFCDLYLIVDLQEPMPFSWLTGIQRSRRVLHLRNYTWNLILHEVNPELVLQQSIFAFLEKINENTSKIFFLNITWK